MNYWTPEAKEWETRATHFGLNERITPDNMQFFFWIRRPDADIAAHLRNS